MMLPTELITNDSEYKHLCSVHGKDAVKILRYIQNQMKQQVFTEKAEGKQKALIYQVKNLELVIQEITDTNIATAPISTI